MGDATRRCFEVQIEMYPAMQMRKKSTRIEEYRDLACGRKVSWYDGSGYWILISEKNDSQCHKNHSLPYKLNSGK